MRFTYSCISLLHVSVMLDFLLHLLNCNMSNVDMQFLIFKVKLQIHLKSSKLVMNFKTPICDAFSYVFRTKYFQK